jgi:NAD(P) transhydrogenase subunit beta
MNQTYVLQDFAVDMGLLVAASGFILGLKYMSHPRTARMGNAIGAVGMFIGTVITLLDPRINDYGGIAVAGLVGAGFGLFAARTVQMTSMPQLVAVFNGLGGAASVLVAGAEFTNYLWNHDETAPVLFSVTGGLSVLIGSVTLTGSFIAFAKLQGVMTSAPITYPGQKFVSSLFALGILGALGYLAFQNPEDPNVFWGMVAASAVLGIMLVIPKSAVPTCPS